MCNTNLNKLEQCIVLKLQNWSMFQCNVFTCSRDASGYLIYFDMSWKVPTFPISVVVLTYDWSMFVKHWNILRWSAVTIVYDVLQWNIQFDSIYFLLQIDNFSSCVHCPTEKYLRDPISSRSIEHTILCGQSTGIIFRKWVLQSFVQVSIWCIWHGINWKYSNGQFFWHSAGPSCHTKWLFSINHFSKLSKYLCSFSRVQMQQSHLKWYLFHKLCYLYRNSQSKNKADTLKNHMVLFQIEGEINTLCYKTLSCTHSTPLEYLFRT